MDCVVMAAAEWTASCHTGRGVPSGFSLADGLGRVRAGGQQGGGFLAGAAVAGFRGRVW